MFALAAVDDEDMKAGQISLPCQGSSLQLGVKGLLMVLKLRWSPLSLMLVLNEAAELRRLEVLSI